MKVCYRGIHKYKYQLMNDYGSQVSIKKYIKTKYIILDTDGELWIKSGYVWDGASGPTIDTKSSMRASLVHDALYQLIRMGKLRVEYRRVADNLFRQMCLDDGMGEFRAWVWYQAVRKFAGYAAKPNNKEDKIICVPSI